MGKPLPLELRRRVVAYVDEGHGHREAARHFRVSPRFVNNLINLRRQTGSLEARRQGHAWLGWITARPNQGILSDLDRLTCPSPIAR